MGLSASWDSLQPVIYVKSIMCDSQGESVSCRLLADLYASMNSPFAFSRIQPIACALEQLQAHQVSYFLWHASVPT